MHTAEERARVEKSTFMRDVRERIARDFGGSVAKATASTTIGQYGGSKGSSGLTSEQLVASQKLRSKEQSINDKRGREKMTQLGWAKLPKDVRDRVLADGSHHYTC